MTIRTNRRSRSIDQVLLRLIFFRLYVPLLAVGLLAVAAVGHFGVRSLNAHQNQVTSGLAQAVVYHVEQGERILDALALAIGDLDRERAGVFIKSTWESYGYFETLYHLDREGRVTLLMPVDRRYAGLDLSNLPEIRGSDPRALRRVSRPYISVRTGEPTVLLVRQIPQGGQMVGELRLGLFQKEIANIVSRSNLDFVFIADQKGTLLAHPQVELVQQQVNVSDLSFFHGNDLEITRLYRHDGVTMMGSASRVERTSWLVIDQVPLSVFAHTYLVVLGQILVLSAIIWATSWWVLRRQLRQRTAEFSQLNAELQEEVRVRSAAEQLLAAKNQEIEAAYLKLQQIQRLETELHQAQKLEAVGRLAAGIAHEINTPIQFIGDNTRFMGEAFASVQQFLGKCQELVRPEAREVLEQVKGELDLDYLIEHAPRTVERSLAGVQRVATIVRAMKEFAHPDQKEMVATDLNRSIEATLEIARNEYKYVADVETDLGELPPVLCHAGDLNQVFLNIVVNAAHAIADVVGKTQGRGKILVRTYRDGEDAVVAISDTGVGIPPEIHHKIFDPFFTTKEVGRGAGQGLAIARSIVAKHRGSIAFETVAGAGTTFTVRVPIDPDRPVSRAANG
jgi:signal transduction histidine kinase